MFKIYDEPLSPTEGSVLKIYDDPEPPSVYIYGVPESPNEEGVLEICDQTEMQKERACLRYMMNRTRQKNRRV